MTNIADANSLCGRRPLALVACFLVNIQHLQLLRGYYYSYCVSRLRFFHRRENEGFRLRSIYVKVSTIDVAACFCVGSWKDDDCLSYRRILWPNSRSLTSLRDYCVWQG